VYLSATFAAALGRDAGFNRVRACWPNYVLELNSFPFPRGDIDVSWDQNIDSHTTETLVLDERKVWLLCSNFLPNCTVSTSCVCL
jgi:hypothetical protein